MSPNEPRLGRRAVLAGIALLAGCTARSGRSPTPPATVEDRPNGVYVPTHAAPLHVVGVASTGRLRCGLCLTHPLRFWVVTGRRASRVDASGDAHLLAVVWDADSGRVLPGVAPRFTVSRGGETVYDAAGWPMLSQRLGFHYGDNVDFGGGGPVRVRVRTAATDTRLARGLDGLDTAAEFAFADVSTDPLGELAFDEPANAGDPGSLPPRPPEGVPVARVPAAGDLPGDPVGSRALGDASVVATALRNTELAGNGAYLAVSPRTPRRYPLPFMTLFGTLRRDGEAVLDDVLAPTLAPDLGYHYGAAVPSIESGDELVVGVGAPPQVARHEGYETAFMETHPLEFRV